MGLQFMNREQNIYQEDVSGVSFLGAAVLTLKAGIVSFTVDGDHAHDVAQLLAIPPRSG